MQVSVFNPLSAESLLDDPDFTFKKDTLLLRSERIRYQQCRKIVAVCSAYISNSSRSSDSLRFYLPRQSSTIIWLTPSFFAAYQEFLKVCIYEFSSVLALYVYACVKEILSILFDLNPG